VQSLLPSFSTSYRKERQREAQLMQTGDFNQNRIVAETTIFCQLSEPYAFYSLSLSMRCPPKQQCRTHSGNDRQNHQQQSTAKILENW